MYKDRDKVLGESEVRLTPYATKREEVIGTSSGDVETNGRPTTLHQIRRAGEAKLSQAQGSLRPIGTTPGKIQISRGA